MACCVKARCFNACDDGMGQGDCARSTKDIVMKVKGKIESGPKGPGVERQFQKVGAPRDVQDIRETRAHDDAMAPARMAVQEANPKPPSATGMKARCAMWALKLVQL